LTLASVVIEIDEEEEDELAAKADVARTSVENRRLKIRISEGGRGRRGREDRERGREGRKSELSVAAAFRRKVSHLSTVDCCKRAL